MDIVRNTAPTNLTDPHPRTTLMSLHSSARTGKGGILFFCSGGVSWASIIQLLQLLQPFALVDDVILKAFQIQMNSMSQMWVPRTLSLHLYWFFVVKCTHLYPGKKAVVPFCLHTQ